MVFLTDIFPTSVFYYIRKKLLELHASIAVKTKDVDRTISNVLEGKVVIPQNASDTSILSQTTKVQKSWADIRSKVNTQVSVSY